MTQRVIKFRRAYFNYDGSFYGFKAWGPNIEGGDGFISPSYIHGCKSGPDQQFSGLTDKHGKEIYEHDIIEYGFNSERRKGKVVYNPQLLKFIVDRGNGHDYDAVNYMNEVEVIGDIYTTPELVDPKMIER